MNKTIIDFAIVRKWLEVDKVPTDTDKLECLIDSFSLIETLVLHERPVIAVPRPYGALLRRDPLTAPFIDAGILEIERNEDLEQVYLSTTTRGPTDLPESLRVLTYRIGILQAGLKTAATDSGRAFVPTMNGRWRAAEEYLLAVIKAFARRKVALSEEGKEATEIAKRALQRVQAIRSAGTAEMGAFDQSYSDVKQYARDTLIHLRRLGRPIPVSIPPIASIVLSSAARRDAIGTIALDLRADLEDARTAFGKYEERIASDELSIGESIDAALTLQAAMDRLLHKERERVLTRISDWKDVVSIAKDLSQGATAGGLVGAAGAMMGRPLRAIDETLQRREVLYMAIIKDRFDAIRNFGTVIPRLFNFTPRPDDESTLEKEAKELAEASTDGLFDQAFDFGERFWARSHRQ